METSLKKSRNTRQRALILDILRDTRCHPTAEAIYLEARRTMPNISLGTVYRNLSFLRNQGLVREVRSNSDVCSRFEDACEPHAHFHCQVCRTVHDIPLPDAVANLSWDGVEKISRVRDLELHVIGACRQCGGSGS
ncbi:MAG: transcriptional repressor [Deltaproteobacteria bacterium]|nr:transcriptional repressor [Deltaproteobacteria bacterium]